MTRENHVSRFTFHARPHKILKTHKILLELVAGQREDKSAGHGKRLPEWHGVELGVVPANEEGQHLAVSELPSITVWSLKEETKPSKVTFARDALKENRISTMIGAYKNTYANIAEEKIKG